MKEGHSVTIEANVVRNVGAQVRQALAGLGLADRLRLEEV